MINLLTLALTHSLMALAAIMLLSREKLDDDDASEAGSGKWRRPDAGGGEG